ncbi:hypothetical protein GT994_00930 [Bifidobacterium longum]|uniref:Bacterial SCP orthologue domain-containing protein n=1 Tax=Bifidobacterium longum TaxID=216816 RepID=A0A6B1W742_BIFLN|nr:hypothetical protein GBL36_09650 [Bifidobacterium longum]KAB6719887.1 hypothetical protein GBL29_09805 [Bifidobacterium longum]KAB6720357.1 hypothetical protein GBL27_09790 [Bifidobacterium longum]KAB6725400.1 hypothetical protein GBL26_09815 [Bifidobacterium longum]KAB6725715.1 hypothetical protein GBL24_09810 [Bifidobacterium longum]
MAERSCIRSHLERSTCPDIPHHTVCHRLHYGRSSGSGAMMGYMAVILEKDLKRGHDALVQWRAAARELADNTPHRLTVSPVLPRPVWAMAVRYSLFLLERRAPGPSVEVRVAPWGAVKILDGPESDPHNLTPPDVIELDPEVWLRLACGITTWAEEKDAGHISAVGERDDLSDLLPL